MKNCKPLLRWAGSKKKLIPILLKYWNSSCYSRYIEPFAGSASFCFHINPKKSVLGDLNTQLIDLYKAVKFDYRSLYREISKYEINEAKYYEVRALDTNKLSNIVQSARFLYLNRFCFNGIYRTNLDGQFNVPWGGLKSGKLPTLEHLEICSSILKNATLVKGDFVNTLSKVKENDFVFLDPPYTIESKRVFKEYDSKIFKNKDLDRLKNWIIHLNNIGAKFVLSYENSHEAKILSEGFYSEEILVRRNIAGFASNRKMATEILISNISF